MAEGARQLASHWFDLPKHANEDPAAATRDTRRRTRWDQQMYWCVEGCERWAGGMSSRKCNGTAILESTVELPDCPKLTRADLTQLGLAIALTLSLQSTRTVETIGAYSHASCSDSSDYLIASDNSYLEKRMWLQRL